VKITTLPVKRVNSISYKEGTYTLFESVPPGANDFVGVPFDVDLILGIVVDVRRTKANYCLLRGHAVIDYALYVAAEISKTWSHGIG
jgi:hypothetical protein